MNLSHLGDIAGNDSDHQTNEASDTCTSTPMSTQSLVSRLSATQALEINSATEASLDSLTSAQQFHCPQQCQLSPEPEQPKAHNEQRVGVVREALFEGIMGSHTKVFIPVAAPHSSS